MPALPGATETTLASASTGSYLVTLTVDENEYKQELRIEGDPDYPDPAITSDELEFFEELLGTGEEDYETDGEAPRRDE